MLAPAKNTGQAQLTHHHTKQQQHFPCFSFLSRLHTRRRDTTAQIKGKNKKKKTTKNPTIRTRGTVCLSLQSRLMYSINKVYIYNHGRAIAKHWTDVSASFDMIRYFMYRAVMGISNNHGRNSIYLQFHFNKKSEMQRQKKENIQIYNSPAEWIGGHGRIVWIIHGRIRPSGSGCRSGCSSVECQC